MRIWQVGAARNPYRVDGVSRTVWLMSLEQARLGHDVSLILDDTASPEAISMASQTRLKLLELESNSLAYERHLRELLDTIPPQIVHMHSVFIPRQAVLAGLLRKYAIPYVITPHAGLAPQVLSRGKVKKSIYSALRERPRFMNAGAIALVTPAEERAVRAYLPDYRGIVRWMPNPVDFSTLDPYRWQGVADPMRLVFLGRFDVLVKGIDILVEIARLLPQVKVDLYGSEDPKTSEWLGRIKRDLPANVTFNDPIFGPAKADALSRASLYIQPSRWEGFPVSVAECLYLGVPSSIAGTLDLAELFEKHDLGLVLSLEPQIAARQIDEALENRRRLEEWSQRGRDFAVRHFAPQTVAQNHITLYDEVLDSPRTAPVAIAAGGNGDSRLHGVHSPGNDNGRSAIRSRLISAQLRGTLKENVSRLVERSSDFLGAAPGARSVVLCYHSINDHPDGLTVAPDVFRSHLNDLRQMGFAFLTFGDLVDRIIRWGTPTDNVVVITFDDGFEDNFTAAAPILADLNVPATFFVTSGLIFGDSKVIEHFRALARLKLPYLSARQLAELHSAGFEIAAHTHSHVNLARLAMAAARQEVMQSKLVLEEAIGASVRSFAYPFGKRHIHYTAQTVDVVRESGFSGAASVAFRAVSGSRAVRLFEIPRFFVVRSDSSRQFRQRVAGHFDWVGSFQESSPRWMKALISPEDAY